MANEVATNQNKPAKTDERQGVPVSKLLIAHSNPHGVRVPYPGRNGEKDHMLHSIEAGTFGDVRFEIEYRPWMRHHRVVRSVKEKTNWKPSHEFFLPESWCAWIPVAG